MDSLDVVELVIQLEHQLDIEIDDEDMEHFVTYGDVIVYLYEQVQKKTGRSTR